MSEFFTGGFTDWHTHVSLMQPHASPITRVVDLGADPAELSAHRRRLEPAGVTLEHAGPMLTTPGGYPTDRDWATPGMVRTLSTLRDADAAVAAVTSNGACAIKVVLHPDAGPTLSDELLRRIVQSAGRTPVVAHTEGVGEAARARRAGITWLAHTPFAERLSDTEIRAQAHTVTWITTLDIHGWGTPDAAFGIAIDNLRRFAAAGGRIRYGTDMGNGPTVPGLNPRELHAMVEAGMTHAQVFAALTPQPVREGEPRVRIPGTPEAPQVHLAELV